MTVRILRHTVLALAVCAAFTLAGLAHAEPPLRVARLGYVTGTVSFSPAGQSDWVRAAINRPLTTGDRLWADTGARAEVQVGGAAIRLGPGTSVDVLNLDDRITQLQLTQGTLQLRVRRLGPNEVFEVDTPNLAVMLRRAGDYRIDVDPNDDATVVQVRSGQAEVYGESASYTVQARRGYRFRGNDLGNSESVGNLPDDSLDLWARRRDRSSDDSVSARYVSSDLVGYEDLDANGTWRADREFGNVWTPSRMPAGWSPYRDGRWAWIDPWGWTWIDDAPWGYAVSHYGRWARLTGGWSWVPGPRRERAVYAPALVAFVGGRGLQLSATVGGGAIGWFPLAPREVYRPAYAVSRPYFETINRSNAVIPAATITNVYNTQIINQTVVSNSVVNNTTHGVVYANQRVAGAVVAVPAAAFVQSQPIARAAMPLTLAAATAAPVATAAAVAPASHSLQGGAAEAKARPPPGRRPVIAHSALPPPPIAFAAQQAHLASRPGRPMDDMQRKEFKPAGAASGPAPGAPVVVTSKAPAPTALPPALPAASAAGPSRRRSEPPMRNAPEQPEPRRRDEKADKADKADKAAPAPAEDRPRVDRRPVESAQPSAAPADAARMEAAKVEAARAGATRAEAAKAAAAKEEAAQARVKSADAARNEVRQATAARSAAARSAAAKAEAAKAEAAMADAARDDSARADKPRADAARTEAIKAEAARAATAPRQAPTPLPRSPPEPEPPRPDRANRERGERQPPTKAESAAVRRGQAAPTDRPAPPGPAGQPRPPKAEAGPKDDEDRKRK